MSDWSESPKGSVSNQPLPSPLPVGGETGERERVVAESRFVYGCLGGGRGRAVLVKLIL